VVFLTVINIFCDDLCSCRLLFLRRRQYCWFTYIDEEIVLGREVSLFIARVSINSANSFS
jgi:hypothetical protein